MKARFFLPALVAVGLLFAASASNASAFELLNRMMGHGCCPSTCGCEPACCPAPAPTCGCEHVHAPVCGCDHAPVCGCEPAPVCGCEADCCDSCCKRPGLLQRLLSRLHRNRCCDSCCEPACCPAPAPTCGCGY